MEPNQQNKQNITRDIEIKNKLTISRGEVGGDNEGRGRGRVVRNMYKGLMDKAKGGRIEGGRWGWLGCGGMVGVK